MEQLAGEGLERDTLVWHTGQADWVRADQVPALNEVMLTIPPPVPRPAGPVPPPTVLPPPPTLGPDPVSRLGDPLASPAAWIRYQPRAFKVLYGWFATLIVLGLVLAVTATVLFILAGNQRSHDRWEQVFRPELGRWDNRFFADLEARSRVQRLTGFGAACVALGSAALLAALILFYVLLYKAWNQIQDGHARTSASRAVGFLFIPFFNLYWLFVAIYGLASDLHNYVVRHRLYGRHGLVPYPVSPGLALACCILMVCNIVPFLNFVTTPATLIVLLVWLGSVRTAAANIAAARLAEATWAPDAVVVAVVPSGKSEHVRFFDGEAPPKKQSGNPSPRPLREAERGSQTENPPLSS